MSTFTAGVLRKSGAGVLFTHDKGARSSIRGVADHLRVAGDCQVLRSPLALDIGGM